MVASLRVRPLLLGACTALSMSVCLTTAARALTPELDGVRAAGSAKESPYASAKDEEHDQHSSTGLHQPLTPTEALGGRRAAGSRKDSPYASAKDDQSVSVEPTLGQLWKLVIPVLLAGGSYTWLRRKERSDVA
jgi:hypothetical protein